MVSQARISAHHENRCDHADNRRYFHFTRLHLDSPIETVDELRSAIACTEWLRVIHLLFLRASRYVCIVTPSSPKDWIASTSASLSTILIFWNANITPGNLVIVSVIPPSSMSMFGNCPFSSSDTSTRGE